MFGSGVADALTETQEKPHGRWEQYLMAEDRSGGKGNERRGYQRIQITPLFGIQARRDEHNDLIEHVWQGQNEPRQQRDLERDADEFRQLGVDWAIEGSLVEPLRRLHEYQQDLTVKHERNRRGYYNGQHRLGDATPQLVEVRAYGQSLAVSFVLHRSLPRVCLVVPASDRLPAERKATGPSAPTSASSVCPDSSRVP